VRKCVCIKRLCESLANEKLIHLTMLFSIVCIVLSNLNIIHGHKYITRFDEDLLKNLEISSTTITIESYDEFELLDRFQCAVECFKDKNTCNGYSFDSITNLCSLFNDPTRTIDHRLTELVKYETKNCVLGQFSC